MRPVPVIEVGAEPSEVAERLESPRVAVDDALLARIRSVCARVDVDDAARVEASRDWWPIAISWAVRGEVPALPAVVVFPGDAEQVADVLRVCNEARVPVTAVAGRSGVCGSSIPAFGGVALDMCSMSGLTELDDTSLLATVLPGTYGPDLEEGLREFGTTLGHWPQSMDISTVGGWIACRSAGQYSTRYGKIEDMVVGLEVALADGSMLRTGGAAPRAAIGGDLTQLFVGSEGTLGVITSALLRVRPVPGAEARRAYGFGSFAEGLDACRRILRRGATPAVVRLYDEVETARNFSIEDRCLLIVLDEADPGLLGATVAIAESECEGSGGSKMDEALVESWLTHRNDVSALAPLYRAGIVVDTIEIAARWSALEDIYRDCVSGLNAIPGTLAASAHQSHAYSDGACLYFTFGGRMPEAAEKEIAVGSPEHDSWAHRYYAAAWDCVMETVLAHGGAISHHHGIGLNRARFVEAALGGGLEILRALKDSLDPRGILNPGKLGLHSPFGEVAWR